MRNLILTLFAFTSLLRVSVGDDDLKPVTEIHLPFAPVLVEPDGPAPAPLPPAPEPKAIDTISKGQLYVVESSIELISLQSPGGYLNVATAKGPISVYGSFADGGEEPEFRTYKSENILIVTGIKPGRTELILIPVGVTSQDAIVRQTLTVSGEGPRPPPDPTPPPEPTPEPTPAPVTSFRVIFVKESGATLNAQQSSVPAAKVIKDYLTARTTPEGGLAGWREYDPDQNTVNEQPYFKELWKRTKPQLKPAPCLIIEVNGHATVMDFPVNVEAAMTTLKQYGGA